MQYPICEVLRKYELVARAVREPSSSFIREDYLVWKLNDGHTAKSIDLIKPAYYGQLLVQPFQEDRNRFIVEPKEAHLYNFRQNNYDLPSPAIVFSERRIKSGEENFVAVINDDSSAVIDLTCDDERVEIINRNYGRFVVKPPLELADKVITLTAIASYGNNKIHPIVNYVSKDFYVSETKPETPRIEINKKGVVGEELTYKVEYNEKELLCMSFTNNGEVRKIDEHTYSIKRNTQGISKIVAFTVRDELTSDYVEVEVPFFNKD